MEIILIEPFGYCAGVTNSINKALEIKNKYNTDKIFILGPLIHNEFTNNELKRKNIKIIDLPYEDYFDYIENLDDKSIIILPAHGTDFKMIDLLINKKITFFDTVCPIVKNINNKLLKYKDKNIIYLGILNHRESYASLRNYKNVSLYDIKSKKLYNYIKKNEVPIIINQSTLSINEINESINILKEKYDINEYINEISICPSIKIRQEKLINHLKKDLNSFFIIIGSETSNNTKSLENLCIKYKKDYILINNVDKITSLNLNKYEKVILISGTSTPNILIENILNYLNN